LKPFSRSASRRNKIAKASGAAKLDRRRAPLSDLPSVAIVYALTAIGVYLYAREALASAPDFPGPESRLPLYLLGILPLSLFIAFALKIRALAIDLRRRRYGSRLRLRLVSLFLAAIIAAALPQGLILTQLTRTAVSSSASSAVREGLKGAMGLVTSYYEDDAKRLASLARNELPGLAEGKIPKSPAPVLEAFKAFEPRMDALEVWRGDASLSFAGEEDARLLSPPATASAGPLPAATRGGVTRLRYLLPWQGYAIVLSLRMPPNFDEAVGSLSEANRTAELMGPFSLFWRKLLILFYAYLVLPLLIIAALLGFAAADLVAEPLSSLEDASRRVASGDFGVRLLVKPGDETARLISSFNRMLAELGRYREGDVRQGKIGAWQDIAQRLAHELRNPLTPIRLSAERVLRAARNDPAKAAEIVEPSMLAIVSEVEAMDALLTDFRAFASLPEPQRDWADLRAVVEEAVAPYAASYPEVRFATEGVTAGLSLRVDRAQLKRALANLLINAIDAMGGKGRIEMACDLVKASDSRYCRLKIRDDGPGIPKEIGDKIFAPYFTTKSSGTGLGLAIVERIVQDHGGSIRFESAEGLGATFLIDLPLDR